MAILELKAARGWSLEQTAKALLVTAATIASWMKRLDEEGPDALVQLRQPVNKFPEFVRYIVQRLKRLCPTMGKVKIAQTLGPSGLAPRIDHRGPDAQGETPPLPTARRRDATNRRRIGSSRPSTPTTSGTSISPQCRPAWAIGVPGFPSHCRSPGRSAGGWRSPSITSLAA